jgi:hypothetical protein
MRAFLLTIFWHRAPPVVATYQSLKEEQWPAQIKISNSHLTIASNTSSGTKTEIGEDNNERPAPNAMAPFELLELSGMPR